MISAELECHQPLIVPQVPLARPAAKPRRQYATQRIDRAVIDDMSKHLIVTGQTDLQVLGEELATVEEALGSTPEDVIGIAIPPSSS